jgi:hypothetical protein
MERCLPGTIMELLPHDGIHFRLRQLQIASVRSKPWSLIYILKLAGIPWPSAIDERIQCGGNN